MGLGLTSDTKMIMLSESAFSRPAWNVMRRCVVEKDQIADNGKKPFSIFVWDVVDKITKDIERYQQHPAALAGFDSEVSS